MRRLVIGQRAIGTAESTLVIAEIGVNHDGAVTRAIELVHAAKQAGADAVKLQLFRADRLMHPSSAFAEYQKSRVNDATPAEMLRRYELSDESARRVVAEIRAAGMLPIATPFSPGDLPLIQSLDLPAIKIASPDIVNKPLLKAAVALGVPLLASTGAASMEEIAMAAGWFEQWRAPYALLHCVSSYPTPAQDTHLCWIAELLNRFSVCVGFSDHSTDLLSGALAVAAGAVVVEKHLTYDRGAAGPDHSASFDPEQFAEYVGLIRRAEILRGTPGKGVLDIEADVRRVSRQSLVMSRAVAAGETLCEQDLTVQRPGTGIPAQAIDEVVGRVAARSLAPGEMVTPASLEG